VKTIKNILNSNFESSFLLINKKIIIRFILFLLIVLTVISSSIYTFSYFFNKKKFIEENLKFFNDLSYFIENLIYTNIDDDLNKINLNIFEDFKKLDTRITIIQSDGKVIFDNKTDTNKIQSHFDRQDLLKLQNREFSYKIMQSKTLNKKLIYFSKKIIINNNLIGFLRLSREINSLRSANLKSIILIIIFNLFIFIFFVLLIYFHNLNLFSFFNLIILKLKNFFKNPQYSFETSSNNFNLKFFLYGKNITNYFESYIIDLFGKLKNEYKEEKIEILKPIFESFGEPIFLFSLTGEAIFLNKEAKEIFIPKNFDYKNKFYWEIFLSDEINNSIQNIIKNKDEINIKKFDEILQIEQYKKLYLVKIIYINSFSSILVTFSNITEIKSYYEMKKILISSISHELKTPLTSINGFIDEIMEVAKNKNENDIISYSEIIKRNCERLIFLTNDLIQIERINYKKELALEEIDLLEELNQICAIFKSSAKNKNIDLIFENKIENLYNIKIITDKNLFYNIFSNLLDNAIKYTDKGFIKIIIDKVEEDYKEGLKNKISITVEDSGIGIDENEIPKIFEPFYCIDKSRSRKYNGTGLGLAIVKSAIDKLGWSIEINSILNKGSKFIVKVS